MTDEQHYMTYDKDPKFLFLETVNEEGLTYQTYGSTAPGGWSYEYGKGRVYTTMLGHTWKDELNPNLDDVTFQALLARGVEWAATGKVTLPPDLGWKPLFNGADLDGTGQLIKQGYCISLHLTIFFQQNIFAFPEFSVVGI